MALLEPLTKYYRLTFHSNGEGGEFDFEICIARSERTFTGDGSEFGSAVAPGMEQLVAVAKGIAAGLEAVSGPNWGNITLRRIETNPSESILVYSVDD